MNWKTKYCVPHHSKRETCKTVTAPKLLIACNPKKVCKFPRQRSPRARLSPSATGLLFICKVFPLPKKGLRKNEQNYCHVSSDMTHRKVFGIQINTGLGCPTSSKRCTFYSPESISAKERPTHLHQVTHPRNMQLPEAGLQDQLVKRQAKRACVLKTNCHINVPGVCALLTLGCQNLMFLLLAQFFSDCIILIFLHICFFLWVMTPVKRTHLTHLWAPGPSTQEALG